jgi:hypothetical protein
MLITDTDHELAAAVQMIVHQADGREDAPRFDHDHVVLRRSGLLSRGGSGEKKRGQVHNRLDELRLHHLARAFVAQMRAGLMSAFHPLQTLVFDKTLSQTHQCSFRMGTCGDDCLR